MAGNKERGAKCAVTNKAKHGEDYYKRIGALGGSVKNPKKGFGSDNRTILERILRKRKLAQQAGARGGKISKRGKNVQVQQEV